jgi:uncharacterized protein YndB with AHSA1/START domain
MMPTTTDPTSDVPVRKTVTVKASAERAFQVFTDGFDSWWPRSHHIGSGQMKKAVIEGHVGGRCYSEQTDGTQCPWGQITLWEPPRRFVIAWQITAEWKYEPDLTRCSEVEVRFTPEAGGSTRVDLEHRCFQRMGPSGDIMRVGVSSPNGWADLLKMYVDRMEKEAA